MVEFGSPALMSSIVKNKRLLVLKYSDFYNHPGVNQKYVLPGGRPNEDETLTNALIREVKEETGLNIQVSEVIHLDLFINKPNGKIRPIAFYKCEIIKEEDIKLSKEHANYRWVSLKEARSLDWVDECFIRFLDKLLID
jgi:8-oxo-dGTP diphosphatase